MYEWRVLRRHQNEILAMCACPNRLDALASRRRGETENALRNRLPVSEASDLMRQNHNHSGC